MKILAISDQHGQLPTIEPCDLLLVAGDQCPDYRRATVAVEQQQWFRNTWLPWRKSQPANECLVTFGNHDYHGESMYSAGDYWRYSADVDGHNTSVIVDHPVVVNGLRIWLTPWSKKFNDWAFMTDEAGLAERYAAITNDVDIIVTHQPPYGYGDRNVLGEHHGSTALLDTINRVNPKAVVCGHIHEAAGFYKMPNGTLVYNVALVDYGYRLVRGATEILL